MSPTTPSPDSAEACYARGKKNFKDREYDAAISDFTKAIRLKPAFAEAYRYRGWSYTAKSQYDQAITDFTEAIRLKPDSADAYHLRGWAHLGKREYCEAVTDCTEASRLQPGCADALRKRIAIESARRSAQSRVTTMTVREAEHLVFDIVTVALEDKSHRYAPVSALKGYDFHQICVAQKLVIANQFLGLAHRDDFQEGFEQYVGGASGWLMSIQMHFVPDDQVDVVGAPRAFEFDDPQFLSEETPNSFGNFCIAVGADDPLFWQKIHTRLGLEYNEKSPKRNIPITPDSELPDRDRTSPEAGCAIFLACFVLQGLGLVVWVFS